MLSTSCSLVDFSEDCTYYGDVNIRFDWSGLLIGDTKPEKMQTVFYATGNNTASYSHTLKGDSVLTGIQEGQYNVLSYNPAEGLTFSEQAGKTINQPVYRENNKKYTIQAPLLYSARSDILVQPFETSSCKLVPISCIQQVRIDFVLIKENLDSEVISLSGELDGVSTSYNLQDMLMGESFACLSYKSVKQPDNNFKANMRVFGLGANSTGLNTPLNTLDVSVLLSDDITYTETIDLTDTFYGFTSPAIHLTIEIRLSALGMNISLTDWYTVDQGEVDI
jgi:hypothetical protein